ncbi:hypothetical protein BN961_02533 [Afipia felis]|jgi:hypothetical protein|uniref:DUF2798 domain-containing protein n=2 Tax=Nitrobacteraceae TaxID=41294 RepID=A0A090MSB9_AFIFE|nr:hypothetical protein BN961_02533 [Afipia felis]
MGDITAMLIPRRYSHFVYGAIQSGVTTGIATAVATSGYEYGGMFLHRWTTTWFTSWLLMMPVVLFVAPAIQRLTVLLTRDRA